MAEWVLTSEQKPEHGQLVVKCWSATGNVWAGKHIAHAKHEAFDKWMALPFGSQPGTPVRPLPLKDS